MPSEDSFFSALYNGQIHILDRLCAADPELPWADGDNGRKILTIAIQWSNEYSLRWVLSKKPEVNFVDETGFTTLKYALGVESGAGLTETLSPPELAWLTIRIIDLLVEAGADLGLTGTLGESVLHTAAKWSSPAVIRHLLHLGADPMVFDHEHEPCQPIHYAEFFERWDSYAVLEEAMKSRQS